MTNVMGRSAFVIAMVAGSLSLGMPSASAHATLERTRPAANARVATEPAELTLFFDEPVDLALGELTVTGPGGTSLVTGYGQLDHRRTVRVTIRPGAGDGTYAVSYRVVSLDAHPVSGGFTFSVGPAAAATSGPAAGTEPPTGSGPAPEDAAVSSIYTLSRYAGFVGFALLVGSVVFLLALRAEGAPARVRRLAWLGYGLTVGGSVGELLLQVPYAAGTSLTTITGSGLLSVLGTTFGKAHETRLALLALTAPLLAALVAGDRRVPRLRRATACAVPLAVGMAGTWAYAGHAAAATPAISIPSDMLHLTAVAVWVGGLLVLAIAVLPRAGARALRAVLPRWSLVAMACVVALVVSGTVQALLEMDDWRRLGDTTYGRLLLAKIGLLVIVLAVAGYSRGWVQRWYLDRPGETAAAEPLPGDVRRLRRAVVTESLLTVAAVGIAAVLIEAAPTPTVAAIPRLAAQSHPVISRQGAYVAAVRRGDVVIHLKVDPGVVGVQYIYLDATRPDGRRIPVRHWTLTVSNAALDLDRVNVPVLVDSGVGHHFVYGSFTMATGGVWTVEVVARISRVGEIVISRRVAVRT